MLVLAVVTFLFFLPRSSSTPAVAQIYQNGALLMTVPLDQPQEFPVEGEYCNTVTVRDGKIAITNSDCPGTDCVHSGWISSSGRSIVCLPNGLEIRVISQSGDVDFIVG